MACAHWFYMSTHTRTLGVRCLQSLEDFGRSGRLMFLCASAYRRKITRLELSWRSAMGRSLGRAVDLATVHLASGADFFLVRGRPNPRNSEWAIRPFKKR